MSTSLASELLRWYWIHGKEYSFRRTTDPYHILVSEILLRQTQAIQVDSVFDRLVEEYPTVSHLASADPVRLTKLLQPLGIIRRAEQLVTVARIIVSEHSGKIPSEMDDLVSLPGVGDYIAGCTLSLSFGDPTPAVDINIERVISRLFGLPQRGGGRPDARVLDAYVRLLRRAGDRSLHYAMIDFAHEVCRQRIPRCEECPLRTQCTYAQSQV
ncbi:MAG: A/G-specific adenine glycosylase [bacterium]